MFSHIPAAEQWNFPEVKTKQGPEIPRILGGEETLLDVPVQESVTRIHEIMDPRMVNCRHFFFPHKKSCSFPQIPKGCLTST